MILIDTDPGLDDAHALAIATARIPHDQLVVTTVAGNTGLDVVTDNAAWLLASFRADVPLYPGATAPLVTEVKHAEHIHGTDGLGNLSRSGENRHKVTEGVAALVIAEHARRYDGELRIVTLGPMTNLALALAIEPRLPELVRDVVVMGGSPSGTGNDSITAEYNVFADPVAADLVFARMPRVTMVSWDLSLATRFSREEMSSFFASDSPQAKTMRRIYDNLRLTDTEHASATQFGCADALAVAVALDERCIAEARQHRIKVGLEGSLARGLTALDRAQWLDGNRPEIRLVTRLDHTALLQALAV